MFKRFFEFLLQNCFAHTNYFNRFLFNFIMTVPNNLKFRDVKCISLATSVFLNYNKSLIIFDFLKNIWTITFSTLQRPFLKELLIWIEIQSLDHLDDCIDCHAGINGTSKAILIVVQRFQTEIYWSVSQKEPSVAKWVTAKVDSEL